MVSLPTPRRLLTSLLNSITDIPLLPKPERGPASRYEDTPSSPLKLVPASHRSLLTTLHVLFPSLLLPALDLLDRGLVTRIILVDGRERLSDGRAGGESHGQPVKIERTDQAAQQGHAPSWPTGTADGTHHLPTAKPGGTEPGFYLVRSIQSAARRQRHSGPGTGSTNAASSIHNPAPAGQTYTIRLEAWNCTCAAFAFAAFPVIPPGPRDVGADRGVLADGPERGVRRGRGDLLEEGQEGTGEDAPWEFGAMSFDGRRGTEDGEGDGDGVPCCKHLLACLLAERWEAVLGQHVAERRIGKDALAGIAADV